MTRLGPPTSTAWALCLIAAVATSSFPPSAPRPDTFSVTPEGDRIVVDIGPGTEMSNLLKACQPFLEGRLYYGPRDLAMPALVDRFEVSQDRLWQRLQPVLAASNVLWVFHDAGGVFVCNRRTARRGDITGRAPYLPLDEILDPSKPWSKLTALVATTVVPLEHLDARQTFTSLRQYFTNANTESLTPIDGSNALVMTAPVPKIFQMARVIEALEEAAQARPWEMRIYELEHVDASAVAAALEKFLDLGTNRPRQPETVLALPERSAVLVHAPTSSHRLIGELVEKLDRP